MCVERKESKTFIHECTAICAHFIESWYLSLQTDHLFFLSFLFWPFGYQPNLLSSNMVFIMLTLLGHEVFCVPIYQQDPVAQLVERGAFDYTIVVEGSIPFWIKLFFVDSTSFQGSRKKIQWIRTSFFCSSSLTY